MPASQLQETIEGVGAAFEDWKSAHGDKYDAIIKRIDGIEAAYNRAAFGGGGISRTKQADWNAQEKIYASFIRSRGAINAGLSTSIDESGGFLVPSIMADQIMERVVDLSPIRQLASVSTMATGDTFEEPIERAGATADWVAEDTARPVTTSPNLKLLSIPLREMYSQPETTQRLLDDSSYDVTAWLNNAIGTAFAVLEGDAFLNGLGTVDPHGLLQYPVAALDDASRPWGEFEYLPSGDAAALPATDPLDVVIKLLGKLRVGYRANASWLMNRTTANLLRTLKNSTGDYLWQPSIQAGEPDRLLGYPVAIDEGMADIAADKTPIAIGDFARGYKIIDRPNISLLIDPYTGKPNVKFYATRRVGAAARDFNAIKFLKISVS